MPITPTYQYEFKTPKNTILTSKTPIFSKFCPRFVRAYAHSTTSILYIYIYHFYRFFFQFGELTNMNLKLLKIQI